MKLQTLASLVDIGKIVIDPAARQRQAGRDRESQKFEVIDLETSIRRFGLLNPLIIDDNFVLQAGERRLTACKNIGLEKVLCRKISDLTPVEGQLIELEENIRRLDLEWQDAALGVAKVHELCLGLDPEWTQAETADRCNLTQSTVNMYLVVAREGWNADGSVANPRIAEAAGFREGYNIYQRKNQRESASALEELLSAPDVAPPELKADLSEGERQEVEGLKALGAPLPQHLLVPAKPRPVIAQPVQEESILHTSFLDWAPQYTGPKFNFIHCDFPYGVNLFDGPQGRGAEPTQGYKDTVDTYETLIRSLCSNLDRVMSVGAHLMFWLSADLHIVANTVRLFNELAPTLKFHKFPLIWSKSDNAGIASDPRHGPRHVYETCLLASRGGRNIARVKGDSYSAPTDKKLHPSTKPEPMLRHFMEMLVDETTTMLDPTCGSGASLRAAESLGASMVVGLEIDRQYVDPARVALKQARAKRLAERSETL